MMLDIVNLSYCYGARTILDNIDLQINAGEIVCLIGPNGTGKSTLLKCINRFLIPQYARVMLEGRALKDFSQRDLARVIAYVPQQTGPTMALRVIDMIALGRVPHRTYTSATHDQEIVIEVIERLHLHMQALRPYDELSGGERQRVLLARALVQQSRLLLLDEPTSELDLYHQLDTMMAIRQIADEQGCGVLIAMHDLALASRFADRLVMLKEGNIVAQGSWQQVLTPQNIKVVYNVDAIVGSDADIPYVIAY